MPGTKVSRKSKCKSKTTRAKADPFETLRTHIALYCAAIESMFTTDVFVSVVVRHAEDKQLRIVVTNDTFDGIKDVLETEFTTEIIPPIYTESHQCAK